MSQSRSRSASPVRSEPKPKKEKTSGFKWKDSKPRSESKTDDKPDLKYRQRSPQRNNDRERRREGDEKREKDAAPPPPSKPKKEKKAKPPPAPTGPMIIVNINDRLGTKAAIPCLASDSVKDFKALVAAHIGRQPHEILLKRQGERPFKDQLSLEDYGVSSGVQLDLELDTGD